jgi:hypothetical protein
MDMFPGAVVTGIKRVAPNKTFPQSSPRPQPLFVACSDGDKVSQTKFLRAAVGPEARQAGGGSG